MEAIKKIGEDKIEVSYKKEKMIFSFNEFQEILNETKELIKDFNEDFFINWEE